MKGSKIILTLLSILVILGLIAYVFPPEGIKIGNVKLTFPSLKEVLLNEKPQYADIDEIVSEETNEKSEDKDVKRVKIKEANIVDIDFPDNDDKYLDRLFIALDNISKTKESVRIIHYGDSQIEGDRITSYLRNRLQQNFGGYGQGEIPLYSHSAINNVTFSYSSNWKFYSIIDTGKRNFARYGLMQTACVPFAESVIDSVTFDTAYKSSAYINLSFRKPISGTVTLYCSNPNVNNSSVKIFNKDNLLNETVLEKDSQLQTIKLHIDAPIKSLRIQTTGMPELYSLDFSDKSGVYVDNVSLRGSSGYGFSRNNSDFLRSMSEKLNVKLLILQFGVNAVPQEEDKIVSSYHFYRVQFSKQIAFLKKTNPNAAIIVIGISDRSRKNGDGYETNPNIPKILAAQKQAAADNDVAFWNLFEAMGGENSMPSWVLREKPLANPDFTHFNSTGAKYVAEMFYKALEKSYKEYSLQK